jgi:hypothetical protein
MYYTFDLYVVAQEKRPEYPWAQLHELWKAVASGIFFLVAKNALIYLTYNLNKPHMKD